MKIKLVGVSIILAMLTMVSVLPMVHAAGALGLPDAELMLVEFAKETGPGTLNSKTDISGLGVRFNFTGLTSGSGTVVGDNFAVNALAGGATKDYGYGFSGPYDFSGYNKYQMVFVNVGSYPVMVCLKMNTGWTNDWSGGAWTGPDGYGASAARDTWWQSPWTSWIAAGSSCIVTLDFSSGVAYGASDDPVSSWRVSDGTSTTVKRLDEVSDIGFQVLGSGTGPWSIVVGKLGTMGVIPEVPLGTVMAFLSMFSILAVFVCFKRFRSRFQLRPRVASA